MRKASIKSHIVDETIIPCRKLLSFQIGCSLSLFEDCKHLFSIEETNKIKGNLRRGNLDIATSQLVSVKLSDARKDGVMSIEDFKNLYQFYSFSKKTPENGVDEVCRKAGLDKLMKGEGHCKVTNMTIESRISSNFQLFDRVSRIILDIIGEVPYDIFTKNQVEFGPGSTVNLDSRSYEQSGLFYKVSDKLIVPNRAKYYLAAHVSSHPNWVDNLGTFYHTQQNSDESRLQFEMRVFESHFQIVDDDYPSRISFVPKDKDEHRAIGIEMNGLVPLQKIVGNHFRRALFKRGINLNSQDRNKHLARLAKVFGLSTIDLKNASSSISLELVRAIMPRDWMAILEGIRSSHGFCRDLDEPIEYQMISSMGNGFTFELESLIFYALVIATCEEGGLSPVEITRSVSVFGDDIIIPRSVSSDFVTNLSLFGFTANKEKSFIDGFFFESCGSDYYRCAEVRPFFLKREVKTVRDLFFCLNSILYRFIKTGISSLRNLYLYMFKFVRNVKAFGPLNFERSLQTGRLDHDDMEAVLRVPLDYAQAHGGVKYDPTLFAWTYRKYIRISVNDPFSQNPQYAVKHVRYQTFLQGTLNGKVLLRGRWRTARKNSICSNWNGTLTTDELRSVKTLFHLLECESELSQV